MRTLEVSEETYEKIKDQVGLDEVEEVEDITELEGKKYAFQCARYIYYGKVKNVNPSWVELDEASVVFDTGNYSDTSAEDIQELPKKKAYVMRQSIEAIYPTRW